MALFLSTHINKVDKKGRVSVPAPFRAEMAAESYQGVVLVRSSTHPALEVFAWSYVQEISRRMENFDLFSTEQDDLAMSIFGDSVQVPMDNDGRIVIPAELLAFCGIDERASFVGMGNKFQIWNTDTLEQRREEARKNVRERGLTLPKGEVK